MYQGCAAISRVVIVGDTGPPPEPSYDDVKHKLKMRDRRTVRRKIASLPTFEPYFLMLVTLIQVSNRVDLHPTALAACHDVM